MVGDANVRYLIGSSDQNFIITRDRGILYADIVTIFIYNCIPSIHMMLYFYTPIPLFFHAVQCIVNPIRHVPGEPNLTVP